MAMRWRASASEWQPYMAHTMDRDGAKTIDKEENRIRLNAACLDALICCRACIVLMLDKMKDTEKMARHTGMWFRWKGCLVQMERIMHTMLDHLCLEQLLSLKNNTQHVRLTMHPENLPGDPETFVMLKADRDRLLCAALAYCEWHCDGCSKEQKDCKIKRLLDDSAYMQSCDLPVDNKSQCRYNMSDVDWDTIRR